MDLSSQRLVIFTYICDTLLGLVYGLALFGAEQIAFVFYREIQNYNV